MTKKIIANAILCANIKPRTNFKKRYKNEIDQFVQEIYNAYIAYKQIDVQWPAKDKNALRNAHTAGYIYKAIQDLVSAFNIFISGYIVAPGNLMRHFHESAAMAILLSCRTVNHFEKFIKNMKKFPVSKVFKYIGDNLSHFDINAKSWKVFIKTKNFYHSFSHATIFALSTSAVMGTNEKLMVLGSYFDSGKIKQYSLEINRMISAAKALQNIIAGVKTQLDNT